MRPIYEGKTLFFIFKDLTSKTETYQAGRMLNTPLPKDGKVVLDFNRSYNPPCTFTPYATCPLPPKENNLAVRIEAGELRYGKGRSGITHWVFRLLRRTADIHDRILRALQLLIICEPRLKLRILSNRKLRIQWPQAVHDESGLRFDQLQPVLRRIGQAHFGVRQMPVGNHAGQQLAVEIRRARRKLGVRKQVRPVSPYQQTMGR